jgi:hypothetical protein
MALSKFVVTNTVTITPDTIATVVAGEPGTGGAAGFGSTATVSPGTGGKYSWLPHTFIRGTAIIADSTGGTTAPQLLYQAIGASNLRAFVDGQDTVSHDGISN